MCMGNPNMSDPASQLIHQPGIERSALLPCIRPSWTSCWMSLSGMREIGQPSKYPNLQDFLYQTLNRWLPAQGECAPV